MSSLEPTPIGPLRDLVHECLADLDELVDAFMAELNAIQPYATGVVPDTELRKDAEASIEYLLRTTAELPVPHRLEDACERIGRRRAHAGVPLEALLRAVRLDFRVMWSAFLRRVDPADLPRLVHSTVHVWDVVEDYSTRVHVSYADEAAVLARERENERGRLVDSLLATQGRDTQVVTQVAQALNADAAANFLVAAAPMAAPRPLRDLAGRLRAKSVPVHVQDVERRAVLIAELPQRSQGAPERWLESVVCGVGPLADGLVDVPRAVRLSSEVAATMSGDEGTPCRLTERWPRVVTARLPEVGSVLRDEVLPPAAATTAHERHRLFETVHAYLRFGSINAVAKEIFCHRNTVLNRIHRFTELTGHDVTRPEHAATVLVAMAGQPSEGRAPEPG